MENFGFVLLAVLLVLLNGFFVAVEFAIVKIRPTRLKTLVDEGRPGAANAMKLVSNLDGYLSATQFGITLASLGLGWVGEPAFAHLIEPGLKRILPESVSAGGVSHTISVAVAFAIITFLHIVAGELAPKSLAIQRAEQTTLAAAWPMRIFYFLFFPGIWVLNKMAARLLKVFGLTTAHEVHEAHSQDELRVIFAESAEAGSLETSRAELLERALMMAEKTARHVLVPRNQVRFIDLDDALEKNIAEVRAAGHTWIPVARGSLDQVEGVVNAKDLFYLLSKNELKAIAQVQRPVLFVPENVTLEQLLSEFRRRKRQIAVVVDEHGGTSGIVTLSDVVAEVVGDVAQLGRRIDEVKTLPGGRLELPGTTPLDDLEDRLGVKFDIEEGEVTTIAGYLMAKLAKVPVAGDKVQLEEYEISVEQTDGPRVLKVKISPILPPAAVAPAPSPPKLDA